MSEENFFWPLSDEIAELVNDTEKAVLFDLLRAAGMEEQYMKPIKVLLDNGCPVRAILALGSIKEG